MTFFTRMIREPALLAEDCVRGESLDRVVKRSLFAIVVGTALFGAILGGTRGGMQVAYSALKLPMALLVTLVVATPAFHAFAALAGKPMPLRSGSALVLAALARASLALLALSPLLWLAVDLGFGYHASIEVAVLLYGVAGLAAVSVIVQGLEGAPHRTRATFAFLCVFLPVFAQTAWVLRPYAGRPSAEVVPFLRGREGSFMGAVTTSAASMLGIYARDARRYDDSYYPTPAQAAPMPEAQTYEYQPMPDRVPALVPLADVPAAPAPMTPPTEELYE